MKNNFWQKINKPILALAPMAGFNNLVFRKLAQDYGADVLYSEMASATAIFYNQKLSNNKTLKLLKRAKGEKYYVAQLFGSNPQHFEVATKIISQEIKVDGLDINFGCPVGKIIKQGAGADLMKNLKKSREIVQAVLNNTNLPVSIKIRARAGEVGALEFIDNLKDLPISALMIHGRSLEQGFRGGIDLKLIAKIKEKYIFKVLANGGINDLKTAKQILKITKCDGLGLARGVLGRPWLFNEIKNNQEINLEKIDLFNLMKKQAKLAEEEFGQEGVIALRKHLCWYLQARPGASALRRKIVQINNYLDLEKTLKI
jgi:tRNA-dihydrouridine synthase B